MENWYPIRLLNIEGKARSVFFETRQERKTALLEIIAAQGFENQLDQYYIFESLSDCSSNPVNLAVHKNTGVKVAIKTILSKTYLRLAKENGISEASAMGLCKKSKYIAKLVEEFMIADKSYIVTKYVESGDLLTYLESKGVDRLPEAEVRDLFKQIATAVAACHEVNVSHRDIKHLNVLI